MGWPKHFSPPSVFTGKLPSSAKVPASMSSLTLPRGLNCRSSMMVNSVMEKQSWTSAMLISLRGP